VRTRLACVRSSEARARVLNLCARIAEFDHPDIGRVRQPKPAARFDRTPAAIRGPAPRIGEHSAIILADLGLETAEIERLAAEKIVRLVKA
jgi:crotonobetainyl-CoA:carnitine CoA-transferase CaiB-like acyl-CoA transferase